MKKCKKLLCLVLALVMALSLCTVAMADDGTTSDIINAILNGYYYGGSSKEGTSFKNGITFEATTLGVIGSNPKIVCDYAVGEDDTVSYCVETPWIGANVVPVDNKISGYYLEAKFALNSTTDRVVELPADKDNYKLAVYDMKSDGTHAAGDTYTTVTAAKVVSNVADSSVTAYFALPELVVSNYEEPITIIKNVEQKGNVAPGKTTFDLEISSYEPVESSESEFDNYFEKFITVTDEFTYVPGTSNYTIKVSGPKAVVDAYIEWGFFVREKAHADDAWECDDAIWLVHMHAWGTDGDTPRLACTVADEWNVVPECNFQANPPVHCDHDTKLTFTNTYTENTTHEHTRRQPSTPATPEAPIASPKTGDMGVALYAAMALLSMSGSAVIIGKKRSK